MNGILLPGRLAAGCARRLLRRESRRVAPQDGLGRPRTPWARLSRWASGTPWMPRRTVRLRLTVLYGALFLACGTGLLLITYLLVAHRLPTYIGQRATASGTAGGGRSVVAFTDSGPAPCKLSTAGLPLQPGSLTGRGPLALTIPASGRDAAAANSMQTQLQQCLAAGQDSELNKLLTESGIALAIMTVASAGLGWLVAGRALRPLRTITSAARSISASSLNARLALTGPDDELKELGDTFDGLLARLEAAFGAQRQFVANASHELRTPLARQQTMIEVALADPDAGVESLRATCRRVLAAGQQQERLIEALLTLARSERGLDGREPVDLRAVTEDIVAARWHEADAGGLSLHTALDPALALGDSRLAERLVANLVDNAMRHNVPGGSAWVTTGTTDGHPFLSVTNTGPGVPPGQVERLFQPFQRLTSGRTARDGLGLGLPIAVAIAHAHGASLRARPHPGGGLEVEVHFLGVPDGRPTGWPAATAGERPVKALAGAR
jgi:signal transduction histidine kinase